MISTGKSIMKNHNRCRKKLSIPETSQTSPSFRMGEHFWLPGHRVHDTDMPVCSRHRARETARQPRQVKARQARTVCVNAEKPDPQA
jgi:hypothetical protein